jgi:hypothetical protein
MLSRFESFVCAAVMIGGLWLAPSAASAQDANARARALFTEGVQLTTSGHLPEAEARFREALALRDAPSIRYNLASVLFQRDSFPEALALAESAAADPTSSAEIRANATTLVEQIGARAGYAQIALSGTASVDVDGYAIEDTSAEVALAPGRHTATATRDGEAVAHADVTLQTGEHRTITLDASEHIAELEPENPPEAIAATPTANAPVTEQWWFWTGIAVTVVGAAAVITAVAVTTPAGTEAPVQGNYDPGILRF